MIVSLLPKQFRCPIAAFINLIIKFLIHETPLTSLHEFLRIFLSLFSFFVLFYLFESWIAVFVFSAVDDISRALLHHLLEMFISLLLIHLPQMLAHHVPVRLNLMLLSSFDLISFLHHKLLHIQRFDVEGISRILKLLREVF